MRGMRAGALAIDPSDARLQRAGSSVIRGTEPTSEGMYFGRADYVGFWQRLFLELVDLVVATVAWVVVSVLAVLVLGVEPREDLVFVVMSVCLLPAAVAYFVLLKRFGRTVGYWLGRARIVSLAGDRPGLWALLVRFLFVGLGPLAVLLDVIWIPSDEQRQALRDKLARTYVVKAHARPAGRGRLKFVQYHILNATFIFCEVERPREGAGVPA